MPSLTINAFKSAATQGYAVKLDQEGNLRSSGNKLMGKIVSWFKWKANPGTFREDNKRVMYAFVDALKEKYGDSFGDMAAERLNIERGKPLTSRKIKSIIEEGEKQKALFKGMNTHLKYMFTEADIHGDPYCFGSVFANVQADFGLQLPLDQIATDRLKHKIRKKINWAGMNGKKPVSLEEGKQIATEEIKEFVERKASLLKKVDQLAQNENEKNILTDFIMKNEEVKSPEYLNIIWQMKDDAQTLITSLSNGTNQQDLLVDMAELFQKSESLTGHYLRTLQKQGKEVGADEILQSTVHMFELAIKTGGLNNTTLANIYDTLNSQEIASIPQSLSSIHMTIASDNPNEGGSARKLEELFTTLHSVVGESLGHSREEIESARSSWPDIDSLVKMPPGISETLQELGFETVYNPGNFESIMKSPVGRSKFMEFTKSEFSDENPDFWFAVQKYRKAPPADRSKMAKEIVDTFIDSKAGREINIESHTRRAILSNFKSRFDETLFDEAYREIEYLMRTDTVPKFARSLT